MTSVERPSNLPRNYSISEYSRSLSEYHRTPSNSPSPPETATIERVQSFTVKRASSYRVPVPKYSPHMGAPLVRTPNRQEQGLTEFPDMAVKSPSLWTRLVNFVLCRRPA